MQHTVAYIAEARHMPEKELVEFALQNQDRYGISFNSQNVPSTSTWFVDALVDDFRKLNPELCELARADWIARIRAENKLN